MRNSMILAIPSQLSPTPIAREIAALSYSQAREIANAKLLLILVFFLRKKSDSQVNGNPIVFAILISPKLSIGAELVS